MTVPGICQTLRCYQGKLWLVKTLRVGLINRQLIPANGHLVGHYFITSPCNPLTLLSALLAAFLVLLLFSNFAPFVP